MVAGAIPNSGTGVINGCYEKNTGILRVIDAKPARRARAGRFPSAGARLGSGARAGARGENGQDGADGRDGADGADGTDGLDGLHGADGADGRDGNSVLNGTSNPSADTGVLGDLYIDTTSSTLYGPKSEAGWGQGVSLVGQQGPQGEQGAAGVGGTLAP